MTDFNTKYLIPGAMYRVTMTDPDSNETQIKTMTGADLKELAYAVGHLYDMTADIIETAETIETTETEQDAETAPAAEPETETAQDAERESRIADIICEIRASRAPYRTKYRTTAKAIRDAMKAGMPTVALGYCELQSLLSCADPEAYTAGVYGWNFDVYQIGGLTICTGYRGMIGADVDTAAAEKAASACDRAGLDARERMLAEWIYATLDALREGARA